jgi:hypothetical protein
LAALAADLVRRRPAAIIARSDISAVAVKAATQDIPIIFDAGNDPVELGLVPSLNHPDGNLTGVILFSRLPKSDLSCYTSGASRRNNCFFDRSRRWSV